MFILFINAVLARVPFWRGLALLLLIPHCSAEGDGLDVFSFQPTVAVQFEAPRQPVQVDADRSTLPRTIAILPFENLTTDPTIADEVRRAFYNQFASKPFGDIELSAVDSHLLALDRGGDAKARTGYGALCRTLGCDGVITGRVTQFRRIFAGVYSELAVAADIALLDAKSGEVLVRRQQEISYRDGGLSLSPVGLAMSAMSAVLNLRDIQRVRLVSELGYAITKTMPDPIGGASVYGPRIQGMLSNAAESPFGLGKVLSVVIQGEPNGLAVFDIGLFRRAIPMTEKSPGLYAGEYQVQDGDAVRQAPLVVTLRGRNGLTSNWQETVLINLDTQAPTPPSGLQVQSRPGEVQLRWLPVTDVPDLAAYQVQRSERPLSGFAPIAVVETPSYVDKDKLDKRLYYYRVIALDQAGNASLAGSTANARIVSRELTTLSGRIDADSELSGQVLINGDVLVAPGATLTLLPGTRIKFANASGLLVRGGLVSDSRDEPVEFVRVGSAAWKGIRVEEGYVGLRGFLISGATTGLVLVHAEGALEGGKFQNCETGLFINGTSGVIARELLLEENRVGARLEQTNVELTRSRIINNELGVEMKGFSGTLRDNVIAHNTVNLRAEAGTLLEANFWGSLDVTALRVEGGVVSEAYNRPPPDGKVVPLRVSPCAGLSEEACQRKTDEILADAGRLFSEKNYGRALSRYEMVIATHPSADSYYFAALCHQEMQEEDLAMERLREGVVAFPIDPSLHRALAMLYYQKGESDAARRHLAEVLRRSPGDRQAAFLLERLGAAKP